jgi:subtilisin
MLTFREFQQLKEERPRFTGKQLVMLDAKATPKSISAQIKNASLRLASFSDYEKGSLSFEKAFEESDGIIFEQFGVAVVNEEREKQVSMLTESKSSRRTFIYSEPERYIYAIVDSFDEFMRGYKSAVDNIYSRITPQIISSSSQNILFPDGDTASWGILATNTLSSQYTGNGIKLAILDTGLHLHHPDFSARVVKTSSFVEDQDFEDGNGHGSHCAGIATGNINTQTSIRYGVAKDAEIYIGKVLSDSGIGSDRSLLAGLEWAITNDCKVISMSLGAPVSIGEPYSNIYNDLAKKALSKGALIVAAAGNESDRAKGIIKPVGHPANCPGIMAVAAVNNQIEIANFSCGSLNPDGQIDICAPGVDIYSSWKSPEYYAKISGTSMATPFVAGIAALFWEKHPEATASEIWMLLTQNAKRLSLNASDVGSGLVQAPK